VPSLIESVNLSDPSVTQILSSIKTSIQNSHYYYTGCHRETIAVIQLYIDICIHSPLSMFYSTLIVYPMQCMTLDRYKTRQHSSKLCLSNCVCFERDDNVCVCALSALILLPSKVVKSRPYSRSMLLVYFGDISLSMRSFDHITTSSLKSKVIFEFSAPVFL